MRCPFCGANKDQLKVIDSRSAEAGDSPGGAIRRRRECLACGKRFTTYERVETTLRLTVIKKDGRRVPWDRERVLTGLLRACYKRPVPEPSLQKLVDDVEDEAQRVHDREVPAEWIGRRVMNKLRALDQVAYVRFASVYQDFKTPEELVEQLQTLLEARRLDDPDQQELFDAARAAAGARAAADGARGSAT